jgi:predicted HTH domain antitoxin
VKAWAEGSLSQGIYVCIWYHLYTVNCLTLKPLAVRIPAEIEKEIIEIIEQEKLDKATVVRNLLEMGIAEWRKQTALEFLREGRVTFAKAAEIAKLSLWEFADLVKKCNVEWVRFTPEEIEKELKEASAAKHK